MKAKLVKSEDLKRLTVEDQVLNLMNQELVNNPSAEQWFVHWNTPLTDLDYFEIRSAVNESGYSLEVDDFKADKPTFIIKKTRNVSIHFEISCDLETTRESEDVIEAWLLEMEENFNDCLGDLEGRLNGPVNEDYVFKVRVDWK